MSRGLRTTIGLLAWALAAFVGWRVATGFMADHLARVAPARALQLRPLDPDAARSFMRGAPSATGVVALARRLLAAEPTTGWAFDVIAGSLPAADREAAYRVAVRRAPRLVRPRVWLANADLRTHRYDDAMRHIDVLLRLTPPYRAPLYPLLTRQARDPAFADALLRRLAATPMWRAEYLGTLLRPASADDAGQSLLARMASGGMLGAEERDHWIDAMLDAGHATQAFAAWAGSLRPTPARLPAVYNGELLAAPTNRGFDWRAADAAGVELDFIPGPDPHVLAARAVFRGRPAAGAGLAHPLVLAPGRYRLTAVMRAAGLQGETGLQWRLRCGDRARVLAAGPPINGTFAWRRFAMDFYVPGDCPGQWLDLANPAPGGAAQTLAGEVSFARVDIDPVQSDAGARIATVRGATVHGLRSEGADFVPVAAGARLGAEDRLVATGPAALTVQYDDGCVVRVPGPGLHVVDASACASADIDGRAALSVLRGAPPRIDVLPEAEAWHVPPIGR